MSNNAAQIGFDASDHGMNHSANLSNGSASFDDWRNKNRWIDGTLESVIDDDIKCTLSEFNKM